MAVLVVTGVSSQPAAATAARHSMEQLTAPVEQGLVALEQLTALAERGLVVLEQLTAPGERGLVEQEDEG